MSRPSVHPDWGALVRRIGVLPKPRLERRSVLRSRACVPAPYVDAADCRQSVLGACSSSISSSISSSNNVSIRTVLHTRSTAPLRRRRDGIRWRDGIAKNGTYQRSSMVSCEHAVGFV